MANESNDRAEQIRRAARLVALDISVGASVSRIAHVLAEALMLVDARHDVATGERGERTADLETLTNERDAALAAVARHEQACARALDERDEERRARDAAEVCAEKARVELEKSRALVDELREQLAAPTVQSAAVKAWSTVDADCRCRIVRMLRYAAPKMIGDEQAADLLDSLSMQAPAIGLGTSASAGVARPGDEVRTGAPTDAAEEVERLRGDIERFKQMNHNQRIAIADLQNEIRSRVALDTEKVKAWLELDQYDRDAVIGSMSNGSASHRRYVAGQILKSLTVPT